MAKLKTTCHLCSLVMKTPSDQDAPGFCEVCGANMQDPMQETSVLNTIVSTEAGGVKAELVTVVLTNKRIFFTGDPAGNSSGGWLGWMLGGLIGGLIEGAIRGAKNANKPRQFVAAKLEDIVQLDVEPGTKLLNKNNRFFKIHTKDGNIFEMQLGKKDGEEWEEEMRRLITPSTL